MYYNPSTGVLNTSGFGVGGVPIIDGNRIAQNIRYNTSVISTNTSAVAGITYIGTAALTLTLPAAPTVGDQITFNNQSAATTSVINPNGLKINGLAENMTMDVAYAACTLVYSGTTNGWVIL